MYHHFSDPVYVDKEHQIIYFSLQECIDAGIGKTEAEILAKGILKVIDEIPAYRDFLNVHVLPDGVEPFDTDYMEKQDDGSYIQKWVILPRDYEYVRNNYTWANLALVRWEHEQQPITIQGVTGISTIIPNDKTRGRINDLITAVVSAEKTGQTITEVDYKTDSGKFIKLSVEQLYSLARQISDYIEQGFTREKEVTEALKTATTLEELAATTTTLADW